jgi:hypothetical protein
VAIAGDKVVVGASYGEVGGNSHQGSAYVFERNMGGPNAWGPLTRLTASDGATSDQFGWDAAVAGDTVVVGAPYHDVGGNENQGSAYIFTVEVTRTYLPLVLRQFS